MFYAAINSYATETSVGFANTWGVIGFATKAQRDEYVAEAEDLATKGIKAGEIRNYGGKAGHISFYDAEGRMHRYMGAEFGEPRFCIEPTAEEIEEAAEHLWPTIRD